MSEIWREVLYEFRVVSNTKPFIFRKSHMVLWSDQPSKFYA